MNNTYVPLFQETLKQSPFWMLVACSMVNLTHWRQAKPVFETLFSRCSGWYTLVSTMDESELEEILRPLGLQKRRAKYIKKLAVEWKAVTDKAFAGDVLYPGGPLLKRDDIMKLPGCGKYAADSWAIFIEGDLTVKPKDGRLQEYLDHVEKSSSEADKPVDAAV